MKALLIALSLMSIIAAPAEASMKHRIAYGLYHYGVHIPVQVVTFIGAWPVLVTRWVDEEVNYSLAYDSDLEECKADGYLAEPIKPPPGPLRMMNK